MQSVRLEPTKLILLGARTDYVPSHPGRRQQYVPGITVGPTADGHLPDVWTLPSFGPKAAAMDSTRALYVTYAWSGLYTTYTSYLYSVHRLEYDLYGIPGTSYVLPMFPLVLLILRGTAVVNRTYGKYKNPYIYPIFTNNIRSYLLSSHSK